MKRNIEILVILSTVLVQINCDILRPRGVSPSRAPLYNPEKSFRCFDNSKTIPFSRVNDDYCDCADASDEPGTSACINGVFYCLNAGHKPMNIDSSRVNDGICDCCDGSDEYASRKIKCTDTCEELGRASREEAQRIAEVIKAGNEVRQEMSQKGIQQKQQYKEKLGELQRNRDEAEKVKAEKEIMKKQAEERENEALEHYRRLEQEEKQKQEEIEKSKVRSEATDTFYKLDVNQDGAVDYQEIKELADLVNKDPKVEISDDEAKRLLNNEDLLDLERFIEQGWSNVKGFILKHTGMYSPPEKKTEDKEEHEEEKEEDLDDDDQDDVDEQDENETESVEEEHAEEAAETPEDDAKEDTEDLPSYRNYDDNTKKLMEEATQARDEYDQAERAVKDIEKEMTDINEYLEKDFGESEEYSPLSGQCFEHIDHEYVYKLCPFDRAIQASKSGSETRLGTWGKWNGPDGDTYSSQLYENGQACWNGPQRSATVHISCGTDNQITSVSEPNKCEYVFEFRTPAACFEREREENVHDEL